MRIPRATDHFPADAFGDARRPGKPIELLLPDGEVVRTDLIAGDGRFRWRGWARPFLAARLAVGDRLRFEPVDLRRWRVIFVRAADLPESPAPPESPSPGNPGASTMPAKTRSSDAAPRLADFASDADVARLIRVAREEDLGPRLDDITSRLFVPADRATVAVMRSRQKGRLSGAALLPAIAKLYDPAIALDLRGVDGQALEPGSIVAEFRGPLRSILAMERVALNFVTHLSGIASLTRQFVDVVGDAKAGVYDTRKTIPGLRGLAKYAVVCGGGHSHRMGLHDAVLVKDNHLAHLALADLPAALGAGIAQARRESPKPAFVEIEVDTLAQLEKVLPLGPDLVLLDNMTLEQLRSAVALRDRVAPKVELEASGGVRLETIRAIALTGVDRIAIGALTHSAPSLDLGLDIDA
ncbi:MAG: carboxylating nicotinate-nucleotide diphosphorylase [Planctomycetota bacterium]|nr:carboxylating nicotinate-nucleotide diphosphorylase [Planctomycetota bacterium]